MSNSNEFHGYLVVAEPGRHMELFNPKSEEEMLRYTDALDHLGIEYLYTPHRVIDTPPFGEGILAELVRVVPDESA